MQPPTLMPTPMTSAGSNPPASERSRAGRATERAERPSSTARANSQLCCSRRYLNRADQLSSTQHKYGVYCSKLVDSPASRAEP
jgi:hypothetical protein